MKTFIIGTAGHIDHGKSSLVKALTGIDPDRLKEEKERGITIDIGFAHFYLSDNTLVSFIDVPGHEKFIKNMIAGSAGINAVILVVAANESVKPQTIEHLRICELLGLKKGFVALTKIDLVDENTLKYVKSEINELLKGTFLENSPIIPFSSATLEGLNNIKYQIELLNQENFTHSLNSHFRMPIDRAFILKGHGLIVTGTIYEGIVYKNQELQIMPVSSICRVKNIQTHGINRVSAEAGCRAALNISGVDKNAIMRGYFLAQPNIFSLSNILEVEIIVFKEFIHNINKMRNLKFYHATSENMCLINYLDKSNDEKYYAQITLNNKSLFLINDKFILRTISPVLTIGGGTIINISEKK